ncbi:MAG: PPC domain-containing protein [Desulfobacter sp.]
MKRFMKLKVAALCLMVLFFTAQHAFCATALTNGVPVTGLSASQGYWLHYEIDVPSGASNLEMAISGGSGDADIYTRFGSQPTTSSYDCRPYESGNNEECTVASPQTGTYYIGIRAYSTFSNVTLVASYSTGGTTGKTFIITAVQDNLDNQDMYDIANGLVGLGYTKTLEDTNVYTSELLDYLGRSITTLYHTGHGNSGSVATYNGSITPSSTTLRAENTFFATCLTLTDTSWKNSFTSSAQTVMGYTKVSYDFTDETVAKNVISELGSGRSYQVAWYLSNVGISSLNDRWAEYVRVGSSIVEYSARTGSTPSYAFSEPFSAIGDTGRVMASPSLLDSTRSFANEFRRAATVEADSVSTYVDADGFGRLANGTITEQDAIAAAEAWLADNGGLPEDAVLESAIAIQRNVDDDTANDVAAYSVHYGRTVDGVKVSGNYVKDHITLLVGQGTVIATSRYWPKVNAMAYDVQQRKPLLTVGQALRIAADQIASAVKGTAPIELTDAEPVYGTYGPMDSGSQLVPAFKVQGTDGHIFVINAETGDLLL